MTQRETAKEAAQRIWKLCEGEPDGRVAPTVCLGHLEQAILDARSTGYDKGDEDGWLRGLRETKRVLGLVRARLPVGAALGVVDRELERIDAIIAIRGVLGEAESLPKSADRP
jgi:hypothetical protein